MTRRVVLSVFGVVLLVVGFCLALAGGAVMAITGSDNRISTGTERLSTSSTALVTEIANISDTDGTADTLGQPDLRLSLSGTASPTFVGVGPADAVDRYLAGAPIEQVSDFDLDPFRLNTTPVAGTARRLSPDYDRGPIRTPYDLVAEVDSAVNLSVHREVLPDPALETWLRDHVIDRIPGASDAS